MAITWDRAAFEAQYSAPAWPWGIRDIARHPVFHYHWWVQRPRLDATASSLLGKGVLKATHVATIGGAYGWSVEALQAAGITAISVDTSAHIHATKDGNEEAELRDVLTRQGFDPDRLPVMLGPDWNTPVNPWSYWLRPKRSTVTVLNEDLSTQKSRNNVRNALGGSLNAILTEWLLDGWQSDAEAMAFASRVQSLRPNATCLVVHVVNDGHGMPNLVWKTKEAWKALLQANGFNDHIVTTALGEFV